MTQSPKKKYKTPILHLNFWVTSIYYTVYDNPLPRDPNTPPFLILWLPWYKGVMEINI